MKIRKGLQYFIMFFIAVVFIFPLIWTLISSFKPEAQIVSYPPRWIPETVTLENYYAVLRDYPYIQWMINSVIITVTSTLFVLFLTSMAAYAFGRLNFKGKRIIFLAVVSMLLIPIQAYVVPLYLLVNIMELQNTYLALIFVAGANVTGVFILTSFFKGIPMELEEAARIDGCKDFGIFFKIMLPLSKAALSSVAILTFIYNWNNFLWPMIVIRENRLLPLPVGIAQFMGQSVSTGAYHYGTALAGACMAIVPSTIVFLLLQKYFVQGIASSGIKG